MRPKADQSARPWFSIPASCRSSLSNCESFDMKSPSRMPISARTKYDWCGTAAKGQSKPERLASDTLGQRRNSHEEFECIRVRRCSGGADVAGLRSDFHNPTGCGDG